MMLHAFRLKLRGLARLILVSRACLRGVGMRLVMRGKVWVLIFGLLKIMMMKNFMCLCLLRMLLIRMFMIGEPTDIMRSKRMIFQSLSVA